MMQEVEVGGLAFQVLGCQNCLGHFLDQMLAGLTKATEPGDAGFPVWTVLLYPAK
jgi:hypothetical protein